MPTISVIPRWQDTVASQLRGRCVAVLDILRATTTIIYALEAGAREVVVCGEVEEARSKARAFEENGLLGGERQGRIIDGFDLGNSPAEYHRPMVRGKSIVLTTTNGTRALQAAAAADVIWVAAFANLTAVIDRFSSGSRDVVLLCSGTEQGFSREDVLAAGAVVDRLDSNDWQLDDAALLARDAWRGVIAEGHLPLGRLLRNSHGGRILIEAGHEPDIDVSAQVDRFTNVPRYDPAQKRVVLDAPAPA